MVKKRRTWKGGPRSSRSYKMDQYRQSKEPWEVARKKKGVVRKHYRKKPRRAGYALVNKHRRRR